MQGGAICCKEWGMTYVIFSLPSLSRKEIFKFRKDGVITLDPYWENKYQKELESV